jgi:3-dehydroquinate synthetase
LAARKTDRVSAVDQVNDDLGYPIVVAADAKVAMRTLLARHGTPALVLCDANRSVQEIASDLFGKKCRIVSFALGESRKRLTTVERVLDAMLQAGVQRDDFVAGVGGGVAADLFGFSAAIYMRGLRYAHVATTLVAMVDAAIGGKTGVDLRGGKNLAGSFRDPVGVVCPLPALATLSPTGYRQGLAEIVKAAIIEGGDFFEQLEELAAHPLRWWPWSDVICNAIKVKTMTVADDRLESGARATLNLGHTFAHAFERASDFKLAHGAAVSLGLRAAGLLALRTGRFSSAEHLRVLTLLTLLGLPLQTALPVEKVLEAMQTDKKKRSGRLRFVLPRAIGDVEYGVVCSERMVKAVLGELREAPGTQRLRARR